MRTVAHACGPSTQEPEAGESQVQGFSGLGNLGPHRVTLRFPKEEEKRGGEGQAVEGRGGERKEGSGGII